MKQLVRPELLQNLSTSYTYLHPDDLRTAGMLSKATDHYITEVAETLSAHDAIISNYSHFEELLH